MAYMHMRNSEEKISAAEQARRYGVSKSSLSMCKYIEEKLGTEVIKGFTSKKTQHLLVNGRRSAYSSISKLYSALKSDKAKPIVARPDDLRVDVKSIEFMARKAMDLLGSHEEQKVYANAIQSLLEDY